MPCWSRAIRSRKRADARRNGSSRSAASYCLVSRSFTTFTGSKAKNMRNDPPPPYRPSLIEENPAVLVWLLLLAAYLILFVIAKYAWYIHDRQIVELTLWLAVFGVAGYLAI